MRREWSVVSGQWSVGSRFFVALLMVFASVTACKKAEPPQSPVPVVKKEAVKPPPAPPQEVKEAKVEEKKAEEVIPQRKRNPFKPFVVKGVGGPIEVVEPKVPLQRFEMSQLKLVAIVWGIDPPVGMVEAPDGKGYIIKKGDLIGNRNGFVAKVDKDQVVVEERFKDYLGEMQVNEIILKLPQPGGGLP
ncbi:MAG: pilus assembly protein PilP [Deltaproteobacteria bacterium]|nr:pilus assembly protein PilP [Deltaproteobacteria bacterium]